MCRFIYWKLAVNISEGDKLVRVHELWLALPTLLLECQELGQDRSWPAPSWPIAGLHSCHQAAIFCEETVAYGLFWCEEVNFDVTKHFILIIKNQKGIFSVFVKLKILHLHWTLTWSLENFISYYFGWVIRTKSRKETLSAKKLKYEAESASCPRGFGRHQRWSSVCWWIRDLRSSSWRIWAISNKYLRILRERNW